MMRPHLKAASLIIVTLLMFSAVPLGKTQTTSEYCSSFLLQDHPDGRQTYELNLTIPAQLYQYYTLQNHFVFSPSDFSRFVTPNALKPVADKLWQIYNNTEDYTNGVLMLVHQITYKEVTPSRYPVETLVNGYGDCDLFAYIAVSILEAGGIPAVIVYYKEQQHMEIAVDLGKAPIQNRTPAYGVTVDNATYYIGECTGGDWRHGWRIGECPAAYQNVTSQVVLLDHMELSAGQISADLRELDPSTLTLELSSSVILQNSEIVITGQILPEVPNENVTLQAQINGGGWGIIATVTTKHDGRFSYSWQPPASGSVEFQASWEGNSKFNGATSVQASAVVVPLYFVLLVLTAVLMGIVAVLVFAVTRHRKRAPQPAGCCCA
jgi:hypothetical protein